MDPLTSIFAVLLIGIPLCVFLCVKLATYAFLRTRQRFNHENPKEKNDGNEQARQRKA
jgi:cytochrome c-type biogenesis protein CcmH/NrfF